MSALLELYQQLILDHSRHPRHFGKVDGFALYAKGHNPLCGDVVEVGLALADGKIEQVQFCGEGCAICKASASVMTESVLHQTLPEVEALVHNFQRLVTTGEASGLVGKLQAFSGVHSFPMRVKCATLAWHTLTAALRGERRAVSSEND